MLWSRHSWISGSDRTKNIKPVLKLKRYSSRSRSRTRGGTPRISLKCSKIKKPWKSQKTGWSPRLSAITNSRRHSLRTATSRSPSIPCSSSEWTQNISRVSLYRLTGSPTKPIKSSTCNTCSTIKALSQCHPTWRTWLSNSGFWLSQAAKRPYLFLHNSSSRPKTSIWLRI